MQAVDVIKTWDHQQDFVGFNRFYFEYFLETGKSNNTHITTPVDLSTLEACAPFK